jgi:hypothetical protein
VYHKEDCYQLVPIIISHFVKGFVKRICKKGMLLPFFDMVSLQKSDEPFSTFYALFLGYTFGIMFLPREYYVVWLFTAVNPIL